MPTAIQITSYGGVEVMQTVDLPIGDPGQGEIRIRHHASGLNYFDTIPYTVSTRKAHLKNMSPLL